MPATRAEIGERKRARTREALIAAAMRVVAHRGPDAASIDHIIAEARVARGTFYNYFATLDDVLIEIASMISDRLLAEAEAQRLLPDPADRVGRAVRSFIRLAAVDRTAGWIIVRIALLAAPLGTNMREMLAVDVDEGLSSGRFHVASAQAASDAILGLGLMGMRSVLHGAAPVDHAEHIAEMVLRALGVPDAAEVAHRSMDDPVSPAVQCG